MASETDHEPTVTEIIERMLVTVIGSAGFWGRQLYLVGGLVPSHMYGPLKAWDPTHAAIRDVDLVVVLMVDDPTAVSHERLARSLAEAGFSQAPSTGDPDHRWRKVADGVSLVLEFICDTDGAGEARESTHRGGQGSQFQALHVRGARLVSLDSKLVLIGAEALEDGGPTTVGVQVAGLMPFMVLKVFAFVDRHRARDAYDIVWSIANHRHGPEGAGREMAASPVAADPLAAEAIALLRSRFAEARNAGPMGYAAFLGVAGNQKPTARLRIEAVETVRIALRAFDAARARAR